MELSKLLGAAFLMAWIAVLAFLPLGGCASGNAKNTLEQIGHQSFGYLISCDAKNWVSDQEAIDFTMDFARAREELQHPGQCNDGCQHDLINWRVGAKLGALCPLKVKP